MRIVSLRHHPCRRSPMPFIYAECMINGIECIQRTRKSNALPPFWDQSLNFMFSDVPNMSVEIKLIESRLMMNDEELGHINIPLSWLPYNYVVAEWVPIPTTRKNVDQMELLCLFNLCDPDVTSFTQERVQFAAQVPWERSQVTKEDLEGLWEPNETFIPPVAPNEIERQMMAQNVQRQLFGHFKFQDPNAQPHTE